jgi:hypothetical protein
MEFYNRFNLVNDFGKYRFTVKCKAFEQEDEEFWRIDYLRIDLNSVIEGLFVVFHRQTGKTQFYSVRDKKCRPIEIFGADREFLSFVKMFQLELKNCGRVRIDLGDLVAKDNHVMRGFSDFTTSL